MTGPALAAVAAATALAATAATPRRSRPRLGRRSPASRPRVGVRLPTRGIAAAFAVVVGALVAPGVAAALVAAAAAALVAARLAGRRQGAGDRAARVEAAPAVLDLLGACLAAGLNPHVSVLRVAERTPEPLRAELARAASDLRLGRSPAAALRDAAERTGLDELRAAAGALEAAERWGTPPAEALAARAEALRSHARLRAEAAAGKAAVRLAFPLVLCFLPAFVLLTVVPTVAGSLHALIP
jgi:pilus assembly protein TadC